MPAVQTTYPTRIPIGYPGQIRSQVNYNSITRSVETAAGIGFGLPVGQGADDKGAVLAGALAGFLGISIKDVTLPVGMGRTTDKFARYDNMGVLTVGEIYVRVGEDVVANDPVWYVSATGVWMKATNTGIVGPIVGARYVTSALSGEIAVVSLGIQK